MPGPNIHMSSMRHAALRLARGRFAPVHAVSKLDRSEQIVGSMAQPGLSCNCALSGQLGPGL
jgi:hypothetical protein